MAQASKTLQYWANGDWNSALIRAEYRGGAYVELRFGEYNPPSEVINVYDYREGKPVIENTQPNVKRVLLDWIRENDEVEKEDNPDMPLRRIWLKAYLDNARF